MTFDPPPYLRDPDPATEWQRGTDADAGPTWSGLFGAAPGIELTGHDDELMGRPATLDGMFVAPDADGRLSIWHERHPDDERPVLCMAMPRAGDPGRRVFDMVAATLPRRP